MDNKNVALIMLAAGKGKRMHVTGINKTALAVGGKPIIGLTLDTVKRMNFGQLIAVVGHESDSVRNVLGNAVEYAVQREQMGTGHAVECALSILSPRISFVLVVNGDDSFRYSSDTYNKLIHACKNSQEGMSLLTLEVIDPTGLGRILCGASGEVFKIVEEKNASIEEREINEINAGAYCFTRSCLEKLISKIELNPVSGEKYITDMVGLAVKHKIPVRPVKLKDPSEWRGINTPLDLERANKHS